MPDHQLGPDPGAIERASKMDRLYFAGHPIETQRIRRIVPGESGDIDPTMSHVIVTVVAPGIRHKRFVRQPQTKGVERD